MKWIKASDELPPAGKPVVIRDEDGYTYSDMAIAWDKDITNYQWLDETEDAGEDWISVEDRLPEESKTVIVYTDLGGTGDMYYSKQYGWHSLKNQAIVTHWRPLPQPPKQ